jgi:general stress protein 26
LHRIGQGRIFLSPHTPKTSDRAERLEEIWALIKHAHSALLVTVSRDGSLDSRPMGCVQGEFDGRIWFFTFANSAKLEEIAGNDRVLISYAQPSKYEYVSLTGRARISFDKQRQAELWSETFRVWFPAGLDDPELALISVEVEEAKYWTNPASAVTYGWAYLKARLFGARPAPEQVADIGTIKP